MDLIETKDARQLHLHRKAMYEETDAYRRRFIDPQTGEILARYVHERPCPVCGTDDSRVILKKNGGTYVKCKLCSMVYLNPVFADAELQKYYQNNNTAQAKAHESESDFYTAIYQKGLTSISRFVSGGRLLDIGCSSGFFLDIAKRQGWSTYGIELNRDEYAIAQAKGHVVWDCPLEDVRTDDAFDVVTLWDVFEHIKYGPSYLKSVRPKLTRDGVVFLQVPNAASLAARMLWERCNMFDGIEHVSLYSPSTIRRLAAATDFEILHMETVIDELKVTKNHLAYEDAYFGEFSASEDVAFLSPELIHANLIGYKIQVVLRPAR